MKYIAFGPTTYITDRILSIISSIYKPAGEYEAHGVKETNIAALMRMKEAIKNSEHHVHLLPMFPGNHLPAFSSLPPSDFDYQTLYFEYSLYDFILYKAIEVMPKDIISIQNINSFILNNEQTIKQWKNLYDALTKAGEYDLSFAKKLNVTKCIENPAEYLSDLLDIPTISVSYAVDENNAETNPTYSNKYGIEEHYFKPLSNVLLSEQTLEFILTH
jgi:hypothetical protein